MKTSGQIRWDGSSKSFTDNIVLGIPIWTEDVEHEFGLATLQIARIQILLALNGWFVRGGLTLGPLYFDDEVVFGPALVEAYELEHQMARDPRIMLSARVARVVKSHLRFYAEPFFSPQNGYVLVDTDDTMFLNYLYDPIGSDEEGTLLSVLKRHRRIVEQRLKENRTRPPIWAKYRWIATYHNFFCARGPKRVAALSIPERRLRMAPTLLVARAKRPKLADVQ